MWSSTEDGRQTRYAKIHNPLVLERGNPHWPDIISVHRLEIEDSEGMLDSFPKNLAEELENIEYFTMSWTKVYVAEAGQKCVPDQK